MLGRVLTAIVTPFREDGAVDLDAFQDLARHLVDNGSDGLVVAGTTGESPTLSDDERRELVEAAVEAVGSDASVVAATGTDSTEHWMHLTKQAAAAGADQARHIVDAGLDLYAGDDSLVLPFLELGGLGGVCVHTHVVGPQVAEQARAAADGDLDRAREIDRALQPAYDLLQVQTNPIAIKAA